jgi:hypothetical protein
MLNLSSRPQPAGLAAVSAPAGTARETSAEDVLVEQIATPWGRCGRCGPSNEAGFMQAPVAERPVALPPVARDGERDADKLCAPGRFSPRGPRETAAAEEAP